KGGGDSRQNRARNVLVVVEVAFALILLVAAGLMIKSFIRLERVNPGFEPNNLLTMQVSVPGSKYKTEAQQNGFYQQAVEHIKSVPGVSGAAVTLTIPSLGPAWTSDFTIEGRPPEEYGKEVRHNVVTTDYFRTMQIPLISGREFTDFDVKGSQSVI